MVDPERNKMVGVGLWDSKEAADAFGAGVWRSDSELRDKINALLAGELSREELANLAIKCATYRRSNDGRKSCLYETLNSSQTA
jgi:hypothetical protein